MLSASTVLGIEAVKHLDAQLTWRVHVISSYNLYTKPHTPHCWPAYEVSKEHPSTFPEQLRTQIGVSIELCCSPPCRYSQFFSDANLDGMRRSAFQMPVGALPTSGLPEKSTAYF